MGSREAPEVAHPPTSAAVPANHFVCARKKESNQRQLNDLDKTIQLIRGYQDPFEPYMKKLRENPGNSINSDTYGIGLAKIAYEAGAVLDFFVDEDNILNLSAVRSLNGDSRI